MLRKISLSFPHLCTHTCRKVISMKKLIPQALTPHGFQKYGRYAALNAPDGPFIGENPVLFYRDLLPLGPSPEPLAASVTQVAPMPLLVDVLEYHTRSWEGFLCLDQNAYICVAPATCGTPPVPETFEAFLVPTGTFVYLHPGVWHYAPFPTEPKPLHSLVLLPERTYQNDCEKVLLPPEEQAEISP